MNIEAGLYQVMGVAVPAEPASTGSAMTREQIDEVLDKLEARFAKGEMTEPTFLTLRDRLQKKLDTLA